MEVKVEMPDSFTHKLVSEGEISYSNKCNIIMDANTTKEVSQETTTEKMDYLILKCAVCSENYSEDRLPRNLSCGHALCTPCAAHCLAEEKLCPECHEKQRVCNVDFLPVNYPLLRLVRSIAIEEIDIGNITAPVYPVDIPDSDQQQDVWKCSGHDNPTLFLCCSCSMWVCQDCLVVDHPLLPRGSCRVLGLKDAMTQVRNEHKKVADQTLKEIEKLKGIFDLEMAMHNFSLKHCSHGNRSHGWLIQRVESQLEELRESNESAVEEAKEIVRKSTDTVNATTSLEVMTASCKEILECQETVEEGAGEEEKKLNPVLKTTLEHLKMDLKPLVEGKTPVYALLDGDGGPRWAPICMKGNRLLLYSLKEGRPPKEGITLPFEFVRKLVPNRAATVFFEVGTEEKLLGRVYVRLHEKDIPLSQQIVLMCSGEKGASYRNTRFHKYDEKESLLKGGDYENNNGTGGRAIVKGLSNYEVDAVFQKTAGCLVAERVSTRFHFHLRNKDKCFHDIVGRVTEGLGFLRVLAKAEPVTKSMIRDCGLFISMKLEEPSELVES